MKKLLLLVLVLVTFSYAEKIKVEKLTYDTKLELYSSISIGKECYFDKRINDEKYFEYLSTELFGDRDAKTIGSNKIVNIVSLLNYLEKNNKALKLEIEKRLVANINSIYTENIIFTENTYINLLKDYNQLSNYILFGKTSDGIKIYLFNYDKNNMDGMSGGLDLANFGQCELAKLAIKNTQLFEELNLKNFEMEK